MAKFTSSATDKVFPIEKFFGVNECPDGDTNLGYGEATNMQNFKITDNLALQKRGGTKDVAGLIGTYSVATAATTTTVQTELNSTTAQFTVYPDISVTTGGVLSLSGTTVAVNYANIASYAGYYWRNIITNLIYKLGTCVYTEATGGTHVTGGSVSVASSESDLGYHGEGERFYFYDAISVASGTVGGAGNAVYRDSVIGDYKYTKFNGNILYEITRQVTTTYGHYFYGKAISYVADDTYEWKFYATTATTESTDTAVRGIWSGLVGCVEYMVAACNGTLWSLTESGGVWTKTSIGAISTTGHVLMFGFDSKLYILDGTQYKVWNGTTLAAVTGYRPLTLTATTPAGAGTVLEGVNKLNGLRRVRFSPTGGTTYQLPETGLTSVDYVKMVADGSAVAYTANTTTGVVTTTPTLTAGTNTLEIGYTFPTTFRASVVGMKYSETFNGETDTRIFLYGDGSNKAFYSGIQNDTGKPSAEYFPYLNEIAVDVANSPITSMIKHYDSLLIYKSDGAFIANYGTITDANGVSVAAFYTSPLNREIGNVALGQAVLIENNPFTLFGRQVYEWKLSSYAAKDERNADPIGARVAQTLAGMDLTTAICFDDKFHTEYYIVQGNTAVVCNYSVSFKGDDGKRTYAWYIYKNFPAICMITYKQEVYFGTADGDIRHLSRDYMNDVGSIIECYWESGSMDFGAPFKRKYSRGLWLGIKPEENGEIKVTAITDRTSSLAEEESASNNTETSASGFFDFLNLDFTTLSFNVSDMPRIDAHKIKAKKFTYYKLIFSSASDNTTATVTNAEISVRYTSNVR